MVSIFEFLDYRDFLREYYNEQKKISTHFSYRYIAQKFDMNLSYISRLYKGSIHLSPKNIKKFTSFCKFTKEESEFFEYLVYFTKARTKRSKDIFWEKLNTIRGIEKIVVSDKEIFDKWYYLAVWNILTFIPFPQNFAVLGAMLIPPITEKRGPKGN